MYKKNIIHCRADVLRHSSEPADNSGVLPGVGMGAGFVPRVQSRGKIEKSG